MMTDVTKIRETNEDRKAKKKANCIHAHWVVICSHCGGILGSEHTGFSVEHKIEQVMIAVTL